MGIKINIGLDPLSRMLFPTALAGNLPSPVLYIQPYWPYISLVLLLLLLLLLSHWPDTWFLWRISSKPKLHIFKPLLILVDTRSNAA